LVIAVVVGGGLWWMRRGRQSTLVETQTGNEPGLVEKKGELVEGFPQIPAYPGATLVRSYKKEDGGKTGWESKWIMQERIPVISAWYLQQFAEEDWDIDEVPEDPNADGEVQLVVSNGDWQVYITLEDEDNTGTTEITAEFPVR